MSGIVHAQLIDTFRSGKRRVMCVTEPGTVKVMSKENGITDAAYSPGDALLVDENDDVICGPVGLIGATDLAERILDGDQRAVTHPLALQTLATALIAFQIDVPPPATEPQSCMASAEPAVASDFYPMENEYGLSGQH